jgi:hypothetical protein
MFKKFSTTYDAAARRAHEEHPELGGPRGILSAQELVAALSTSALARKYDLPTEMLNEHPGSILRVKLRHAFASAHRVEAWIRLTGNPKEVVQLQVRWYKRSSQKPFFTLVANFDLQTGAVGDVLI